VKIWFQNRRSKYKKLLKQFGLSTAARGVVVGGPSSDAVMESTVSGSDLSPESSATAAALDHAAIHIKTSPRSNFDDVVSDSLPHPAQVRGLDSTTKRFLRCKAV